MTTELNSVAPLLPGREVTIEKVVVQFSNGWDMLIEGPIAFDIDTEIHKTKTGAFPGDSSVRIHVPRATVTARQALREVTLPDGSTVEIPR